MVIAQMRKKRHEKECSCRGGSGRIEQLEDFGEEAGVGSEEGSGLIGWIALPIGGGGSGPSKDGEEGGEVPEIEDGIRHDDRLAGGDEGVTVTIAPCAAGIGGLEEIGPTFWGVDIGRSGRIGGKDGASAEWGRVFGEAEGGTVEPCLLVIADKELLQGGQVDGGPDGF